MAAEMAKEAVCSSDVRDPDGRLPCSKLPLLGSAPEALASASSGLLRFCSEVGITEERESRGLGVLVTAGCFCGGASAVEVVTPISSACHLVVSVLVVTGCFCGGASAVEVVTLISSACHRSRCCGATDGGSKEAEERRRNVPLRNIPPRPPFPVLRCYGLREDEGTPEAPSRRLELGVILRPAGPQKSYSEGI